MADGSFPAPEGAPLPPAFSCVVDASLFRRAWLAVSTEAYRYYLNGVRVERCPEGGALMIATNGHMMVVVRDPNGIVEGADIVKLERPLVAALAGGKALIARRLLVVTRGEGRAKAFLADIPPPKKPAPGEPEPNVHEIAREAAADPDGRIIAAQFAGATIDGAFPDWRRVLPEKLRPDLPIPQVNEVLLAKAAEALGFGKERSVRLTATGEQDHAPVLVSGVVPHVEAVAIVMGMRSANALPTIPSWVAAKVAA